MTSEVREPSAKYLITENDLSPEFGPIPDDWEVVRIGALIDLLTGFPFPSAGYTESGTRLLRGSNVKRGRTDWDEALTQYWPAITSETAKFQLACGDLVIAMDGSLVGRSYARLCSSDLPALLLQRVARIRSKKLDVGYLTAFVSGDNFVRYIDSVKTVTAIPHISPTDIRHFAIPIPPSLDEQHAIATALSDVDALITGLERLIAKKRDIKQAAMQQLLTGQTRLPGFNGDWELKRLGQLGTFLKGSGVKRNQTLSGELPCIRYGEIYTIHSDVVRTFHSHISQQVAATATRIQAGDLLFAGSGETKTEIGKCVAIASPVEAYAGGDIVILRLRVGDPAFFGYQLNMPSVVRQKANLGQGDAVVHISASALSSVQVPVPTQEEQTAIATVLSDMDAELSALEDRLTKTRAIKQGMMQELLTGRTRLI